MADAEGTTAGARPLTWLDRAFGCVLLALVGGVALACVIIAIGRAKECAPQPAPSPYPGAATAERVQHTTAVIISEERVTTYTTRGVPIQRLVDHYAAEMRATCPAGRAVQLAPTTASSSGDVLYRGGCAIMEGGDTFYPEGGYSFKDTQTFAVDAVLHPDGTVDVTQTDAYSTRC